MALRYFRKTVAAAALAFAFAAGAASAQEIKLVVSTMSPAGSTNYEKVFKPWATRVNEQAKGVMQVEVREGLTLANYGNIYSRVQDDVLQIGWLMHGFIAGQFPGTSVVSLPFLVENAEQASIALWRLYAAGLLDAEYAETVPLMFGVFGQFQFHLAKPLPSLATLGGLKVAASTKTQLDIIERLGGTPLSISPAERYMAIQRGTVDGTLIAWSALDTFKLNEVTSYHLETALGATTSMIFMSKKKFQSLPEAARKVLEANGKESASRAFGQYLDWHMDAERQKFAKLPKHTLVNLTPEQTAAWRDKALPLNEQWAKSVPNGEKILAGYREILAQVKTELAQKR